MKFIKLLTPAIAFLILSGCSKEKSAPPPDDSLDVAYMSLTVKTVERTRSSGEDPGLTPESALNTIYVFTFDNTDKVLKVPNSNFYYTTVTTSTPPAIKMNPNSEKILVVANPGTKLTQVFTLIDGNTDFTTINKAITGAGLGEITTSGFTMISSGIEESNAVVGDKISDPLLVIPDGKIKKLAQYNSEAAAMQAAQSDRLDITIERMAAKVELQLKSIVEVVPSTAKFDFEGWTLDGTNSTFYPFAEKTLLSVDHTQGVYKFNFYTEDPNFSNAVGILKNTIRLTDYSPVLVVPYDWYDATQNNYTYAIENTMEAVEQKYTNATRVIIKGAYYPDASWPEATSAGDWFNFANVNYQNLDALQTAAAVAGSGSHLQEACDKMYTKIAAFAAAASPVISLTGTNFASLIQGDLDKIPNGGEVIKDGLNDVIRWYQKGLCYYRYEIRHDNETTAEMTFGKYGVVRNNWYSLTLGKVGGAGSPWYPDIDNPGPGDPDPPGPIDETAGYLGIEIDTAPWIIWRNEIEI